MGSGWGATSAAPTQLRGPRRLGADASPASVFRHRRCRAVPEFTTANSLPRGARGLAVFCLLGLV